jgi:hypothetical protein
LSPNALNLSLNFDLFGRQPRNDLQPLSEKQNFEVKLIVRLKEREQKRLKLAKQSGIADLHAQMILKRNTSLPPDLEWKFSEANRGIDFPPPQAYYAFVACCRRTIKTLIKQQNAL